MGVAFWAARAAMSLSHTMGNKLLTVCTNILYGTSLSDMETCYKVFTREVAEKLHLKSPGWGFDPEITAKILKRGYRIYEVPLSTRPAVQRGQEDQLA